MENEKTGDLLRQLKATAQIVKDLNLFYQDEIIIAAVEKLCDLFQVSYTAIFLYDTRDNTLSLQHHNSDVVFEEKLFAMGDDNILGHVMQQEHPVSLKSVDEYAKDNQLEFPHLDFYNCLINHCLILPLVIGKGRERQFIGLLVLANRTNHLPFGEGEEYLAVQATEVLAQALARSRMTEASKGPDVDVLTDAYRWHPFYEYFAREVYRSRRYQSPLSIILLDVDGMDAINQEHGREAGDYILREGAKMIHKALRTLDLVSRKEDCFYIILPETKIADGMIVAERLRKSFEDRHFNYAGKGIPAKVSLGVAECSPDDTPVSFMNKGKLSLKHAKEKGGDQIAVYHIMREAEEKSRLRP